MNCTCSARRTTGTRTTAARPRPFGTEVDAVGLATQEWRLKTFTGEEYRELYQRMAAGTVKVERYSDTTAMPQTQNVTVDQPNQ